MANLVKNGHKSRTIRSPRARETFLKALAIRTNVTEACDAANISRQSAYEWKRDDPEFAAEWDASVERAVDRAEAEAWRRAVEGAEKPVFYQGVRCDNNEVRDFSDHLLERILRGRRREIYGDRTEVEHTGPGGGPVQMMVITAEVEV